MIAFLRNEPGAEVVESFLITETCMAHAVNVCEVYYDFLRASDEQTAEQTVSDLISLEITIREDMDISFWQDVGKLKAAVRRISLADCFAVALAKRTASEIVTSDHHEFDPLAETGICRVFFIR